MSEKDFTLAQRQSQAMQDLTVGRQCFCIGPQDGQPLCPCRMRNVRIVNGRYVETIDHGPAPEALKDD